MSTRLHGLSARALLAAYDATELSPVEVTEAALSRIDSLNPQINAIYYLDYESARASARASEARWIAGKPCGPLDGLPTTIKDGLGVTGMPMVRGSAAGNPVLSTNDHPTVARMREAGAVFLGKNAMCDYGILPGGISSRHGVTRNPWDLAKTPGASSSGASASVAAGIEPVSMGTDIVGSIRLPASYCGLAGFKPSQGRVPYYPSTSPSLVAGPLAREFGDIALMMNVLISPDSRDFSALPQDRQNYLKTLGQLEVKNTKIRVLTELGIGLPVAEDVRKAVLDTAKLLSDMGARVEYIDTPPFQRGEWKSAELFYMVRTLSELQYQPETERNKTPLINEWTAAAGKLSAVDHHRNFEAIQSQREQAHRLIGDADFLLLPATPDTAFPAEQAGDDHQQFFESWGNTFLFNLTEQPASSVPAGLDNNGLPIGIQIVGKRFADRDVLDLSWQLEQALPSMPLNPFMANPT